MRITLENKTRYPAGRWSLSLKQTNKEAFCNPCVLPVSTRSTGVSGTWGDLPCLSVDFKCFDHWLYGLPVMSLVFLSFLSLGKQYWFWFGFSQWFIRTFIRVCDKGKHHGRGHEMKSFCSVCDGRKARKSEGQGNTCKDTSPLTYCLQVDPISQYPILVHPQMV